MTMFFENWIPLVTAGSLLLAVSGPLAKQTQKRAAYIASGVAVLLIVLGIALDKFVETDREAIESALLGAIEQLEANDLEATLAYISEEAEATRVLTRFGAENYHVDFATVRDLEIAVNLLTSPPTATVSFRGIGSGKAIAGEFPGIGGGVQLDIVVPYRKEGDRWMIFEPVHYDRSNSSDSVAKPPESYDP